MEDRDLMVEEFENLLKINIALGIIPVFVMIGVTRLIARQERTQREISETKQDVAVLKAQREEDRAKIERLQDFQNHISERRD